MLNEFLAEWPAISKAVVFILLEIMSFIFMTRLMIYYIPPSARNRLLGRMGGLLISLVWSWFYIRTLSAFVSTNEVIRLVFYIVFVFCNFCIVRAVYK